MDNSDIGSPKMPALVPIPGSERSPVAGAKVLGKTTPSETVRITVVLKPKAPIAEHAASVVPAQLHGTSVEEHHAAYAETFGADEDAIFAVRDYAEKFGLHVISVDPKRRVVQLEGTVENVERAFGTTLYDHEKDGNTFRGREGPLLLPADIAPYIEAVLGLDSRPVARPRISPHAVNVDKSYYPNELAKLYSYPDGDGSGQTIALIELGGNFSDADLDAYFAAAGTPRPTVQTVSVTPDKPVAYGSDTESDGEVMLDIEVVGAIAPAATIVVYFAANTDDGFYEAVSQAVHDPATTAVSISWGGAEVFWSGQTMDTWETLAQSAALLNVSVFAASGDHGAPDQSPPGVDGKQHVDFPASTPHIIACGGTNIETADGKITNETVWNDNDGWATGGGVSTHFAVPDWQTDFSADGEHVMTMRGVPDVAGNADPRSGINVRSNGVNGVSGGTSAVAPLWAALTAILAQKIGTKPGFFAPLLYQSSNALNDIVNGENSAYGVAGFNAQAGWDACTGLGSPIGTSILPLFVAAAPPEPAVS